MTTRRPPRLAPQGYQENAPLKHSPTAQAVGVGSNVTACRRSYVRALRSSAMPLVPGHSHCASTMAGFERHRLFNNGDRCNVRKEAISRDVEGAPTGKTLSHQNEAIRANRRETTTCSRVWKMPGQGYGRVWAKNFQGYEHVCPRILTS